MLFRSRVEPMEREREQVLPPYPCHLPEVPRQVYGEVKSALATAALCLAGHPKNTGTNMPFRNCWTPAIKRNGLPTAKKPSTGHSQSSATLRNIPTGSLSATTRLWYDIFQKDKD